MEVWVMVEQVGECVPQVTLVTTDSVLAHKEYDKASARLAAMNVVGADEPLTPYSLDLSRHEVQVPVQPQMPWPANTWRKIGGG